MNSHGPDCPADEQIVLLVEGKLEPAALQRVQEHVDGCVHCRRLLSALARSGEPATETGGGWGTASEPEVAPGTRVDRYIVLERVGSGGMGVVFSAYDPELKRKIALKFLKERAGDEVPRQRARLLREAQALARISHPNVVHVFDVGYWGAHVFLAIELSEGVTSRQWLAATPRRFGEVLDVFVQAARGLIAVHDAGLLHRDFKLDNLLVEESGRARVTDFGLAWSGPLAPGSEKFVVGTPGFIAPELLQGLSADVRADQFSFAVAFYRAIYGRDPFGTTDAMLEGVRVEWPKVAGVPRWVEAVLKRALSLDPEQRYPSMAALLAALTDEPSRRRRRALAAVAAVGVGALVAAGWAVRHRPACDFGESEFSRVWSEPDRAAVQHAFAATGAPFAETAWAQTERELDRYRDLWGDEHLRACEATEVRGEQSSESLELRYACLGSRLREVRQLLDALRQADVTVVENAPRAVLALRSAGECGELAALKSERARTLALPRADLDQVQEALGQAGALQSVGKAKEALERLAPLEAKAAALGDRGLSAAVLLRHAEIQRDLGALDDAEALMHRAATEATAARDDAALARAWTALTDEVGITRRLPREAERWSGYAQAAVARLDSPIELAAPLVCTLGRIHTHVGKLDLGQEELRRCFDLQQRLNGPESLAVAEALSAQAGALIESGKTHEAVDAARRAFELARRLVGPAHPSAATLENHLASVLYTIGRYDEALPLYEESLAVMERAVGKDSARLPLFLDNLANVYSSLGRFDDAQRLLARALELDIRAAGPESSVVAQIENNIAATYQDAGDLQRAHEHFQRSLEVSERIEGPTSARLAQALSGLGQTALGLGHAEESARDCARALELLKGVPRAVPEALTCLGRAELELGRLAPAVTHLEAAVAQLEERGDAPVNLAEPRFALARALWPVSAERARAVGLARQAREAFGGSPSGRAADVDAWLKAHPVGPHR